MGQAIVMTPPIVYILDDNPIMAESISLIIESIGIEARSYTCFEEFLSDFSIEQHGCLLVEAYMVEINGLEVQSKLKEMGATLPIIFMSVYEDVSIVVKALKNGACDFIIKPFNDYLLLDSVKSALYKDKESREQIIDMHESQVKLSKLSDRELQVLQGIVNGKQNKDISAELNISLKTIEAHRARLMKKMGIKSVSELVKFAIKQHILFQ